MLWSVIAMKGGFHFCKGHMLAWKPVENALYCLAKAV